MSTGQPDLDAERAEAGAGADAALAALRDPACTIVAARTDGTAAIVRGLPPEVDHTTLDAPVLAVAGEQPVVAVALDLARDTEIIAHLGRFQDPRAAIVSQTRPDRLLGAIGFAQWRARTRFCPRDGAGLAPRADGRVLTCERCGTEHFPRLEPAVIMRVTDAEDRILLGRQPSWPPHRYSVLAGFVDPGESVEDAVRREILEEVGLRVDAVTYEASQPWPFPASLMLGYGAVARSTAVTLDDEIVEAPWFTRAELVQAMERGAAFIPPDISIAHRLIMSWLREDRAVATWYDQR